MLARKQDEGFIHGKLPPTIRVHSLNPLLLPGVTAAGTSCGALKLLLHFRTNSHNQILIIAAEEEEGSCLAVESTASEQKQTGQTG